MSFVSVVSVVIHLALFVVGLVLALGLRRHDPKAAALTATGFGVQIVVPLISVLQGLVISAVVDARGAGDIEAAVTPLSLLFGVVIALIRLAGIALIFFGMLRVMRGTGAAAAPSGPYGPPDAGPTGVAR